MDPMTDTTATATTGTTTGRDRTQSTTGVVFVPVEEYALSWTWIPG